MIFAFTFVFLPDYFDNENVAGGVFIAISIYFLVAMSYWSFVKTVFTNPGDTPCQYSHPLSELDNSRIQTEESERPNLKEVYKNILRNFPNNSKNSDAIG